MDGINFDLHRGEILGLVGESGCGKTTAGRLIARLEDPTEGRINFEGVDIASLAGLLLRLLLGFRSASYLRSRTGSHRK